MLRTVKVRSADFTRLENIQRLVREVVAGGVPVRQARERLDAVASAPTRTGAGWSPCRWRCWARRWPR